MLGRSRSPRRSRQSSLSERRLPPQSNRRHRTRSWSEPTDHLPTYQPPGPLQGQLFIGGGGTTRRFLLPLLRAFVKQNPGVVYELTLRGSQTAPRGLGDDEYNLGVMSRRITPEEKASVRKETGHEVIEVAIALDALMVLVNEKNPRRGSRFHNWTRCTVWKSWQATTSELNSGLISE